MLSRTILGCGLLVLVCILAGFTDVKSPEPPASQLIEFPATMEQKVVAGSTPVGTKVHARLIISTLVRGTVVPRKAIISGVVTESVAKSSNTPSKLGIRMDTAQWKNGSLAFKLYLTEWYVKLLMSNEAAQGDSAYHGRLGSADNLPSLRSSPVGGGGLAPENNPPSIPPAPDPAPPPTAIASYARAYRVRMRYVDAQKLTDGSIVITSKKSTLKLVKNVVYVFAGHDSPPPR